MTDAVQTIERLPDESAKAYQARVEYVTAGPNRSLEKLRQQIGKGSVRYLEQWSARFDWVECARRYDEQAAFLVTQEAMEEYRASLADYRKRYGDMGRALYISASKLVKKINAMLDTVEHVNPGSLLTAMNAAKTAADLEALALRVEHLLNESRPE